MINEEAISYLENAICELDAGIKFYSGTIKEEIIEQRECFITSISTLREQAERDKGCEYCLQEETMAYGEDSMKRSAYIYLDGNLLTADLYSDSMAVAICFCPMCGRTLKGGE